MRRNARLRYRLLQSLSLAVVTVTIPAPVSAQRAVPRDSAASLPQIVTRTTAPTTKSEVGTRLGFDWLHTPVSVDVAEQRRLQDLGRSTAIESVRGIPGVTAAARPGSAGSFSARGFTENGLGVLYDGIRVQASTLTMRAYDAFNFDRVEVLRGPASVLYGEGNAAGAVNFVRRKPVAGQLAVEALAQGMSGGLDGARAGVAVTGTIAPRVDVVASASVNRFDTWVAGNSHEYRHVVLGVNGRASERTHLLLEADWLDNEVDDAYWGVPLVNGTVPNPFRVTNFNRSAQNRYRDQVGWLRGVAEHTWGASARYQGQAYAYQADRDWRNHFVFGYIPPTAAQPSALVERILVENLAYDHSLVGTRHLISIDRTLAGRAARTVAGVEASRTWFSSPRSYAPRQRVATAGPETADRDVFLPQQDSRRADVDATQLFVEQRVEAVRGVTVIGGVNLNTIDVGIRRPVNNVAFSRTFRPVTWRVGAVADIAQGQSLYAQIATGSEPVGALLILGPTDSAFTLTRTRQLELGTRRLFSEGRTQISFAGYWIARNNLVTADPADPTRSLQIGKQSSRGLEASVTSRPTTHWLLEGNVALVRARFDSLVEGTANRSGKIPPNVPARVVNAGIEWAPTTRVAIGGWFNHAGRAAGENANEFFLPSYALVDVHVRASVTSRLDVTARVKNVFDEQYLDWATRSSGQTNVYVGAPRTVELMFRSALRR